MTVEENILWSKISSFKLEDANSSFKFSQRLARENGWTINYTEKVIDEYLKFIFLCCITQTGVTPSDQVDQVWHLHLTYSKSYWIDLCNNILSREIHHNPTKGGHLEGIRYNDFYSETIKLYIEKFKIDPPIEIWPDNKKRFSDIKFQRINIKDYWLIRKPNFNKYNKTILSLVIPTLFFVFLQSYYDLFPFAWLIITIGSFIWLFFKNKNGNDGSGYNGCSSSGCSDHSGHSGCNGDSGCGGGGGCSGCGGGD